ncbi:MAG: hypothetical protein EA376_10430 [Phycisphaeraceae bacterium]|nr:MAG: hypothetical protein EA376_10430 [Phycisphaeraceae bacterium]
MRTLMNRPRTLTCLVLAAGLAAPLTCIADDALPVRKITLYRSGVGDFQHFGTIEGDRTVSLSVDKDAVNDILKSLVASVDGGRVLNVQYDSQAPLARRLASFGVDLGKNPKIAEILAGLRGESIRLQMAGERAEGVILGVESRQAPSQNDRSMIAQPFVNLLTSGGIRSLPVYSITSFELLNAGLNDELNQALALLASARSERQATIDVSFAGHGARRASISYVHETPVWKTTYRLSLPELDGDARMQGWAIVENTTEHDWNDVELSLVAGNPVAFVMDLHTPLFMQRPTVAVPVMGLAAAARIYDDAVADFQTRRAMRESAEGAAAVAMRSRAVDRMGQNTGPAPGSVYRDTDMQEMDALRFEESGGVISGATGAETGEQFQYRIDFPVSIERNRSAMLPIITGPIEGRRISIYNPSDQAEHPMRGFELTNSSGVELTPGPISVYDGGSYAGDAMIGFTSRGQQRLFSYAVDLDVRALTDVKQTSSSSITRIVKGTMERQTRHRQTTSYTFVSRNAERDRTILVEHRKPTGWELKNPSEPASESATLWRFEVDLPAGERETLDVVVERIERTQLTVANLRPDALLNYVQSGEVSGEIRKAIERAAELHGRVLDLESRVNAFNERRAEITRDQTRIRSNMNSIDRNSELYRRYMTQLGEQETELQRLLEQRDEIQKELDTARFERDDYLRNLTVE